MTTRFKIGMLVSTYTVNYQHFILYTGMHHICAITIYVPLVYNKQLLPQKVLTPQVNKLRHIITPKNNFVFMMLFTIMLDVCVPLLCNMIFTSRVRTASLNC